MSQMNSSKLSKSSKIKIHIVSMIKAISQCKNDGKSDEEISIHIRAKFNQLHMNYPGIYKMILDKGDKFEMNRLDDMFKIISSVNDKKISYSNASEYIGQTYYDEFVKPYINDKIEKE